jgi:hypothetical protein
MAVFQRTVVDHTHSTCPSRRTVALAIEHYPHRSFAKIPRRVAGHSAIAGSIFFGR